eukprot:1153256-Pelagomonas_calceolata.AAC.1
MMCSHGVLTQGHVGGVSQAGSFILLFHVGWDGVHSCTISYTGKLEGSEGKQVPCNVQEQLALQHSAIHAQEFTRHVRLQEGPLVPLGTANQCNSYTGKHWLCQLAVLP